MPKQKFTIMLLFLFIAGFLTTGWAADTELGGVLFPTEKEVAEKKLALNGVAIRKALGFIKVFVGGLYLENPTQNAEEVIASDQVKHLYLHYLTDKATAKKLQNGFIKAITKANPPELVDKNQAEIDLYASWLDQDMKPGSTTVSTYIPGKGLTLWVNEVEKGTIDNPEFVQMYYRYTVGEKADSALRKGYLGL